ncbi:hypothetical protein ACJMK2_044649, partial [Sinanodonta woodiana]
FTLLDNLDTSNDHVQQANKTPPKAKTPSLKIKSIDANSLVSDNKYAALCEILKNHNPDILTVCETKLDNTISDSAVLPQDSGYEIVVRKDNKQGAGGVLIAVRNTLIASPVNDINTNCEIAWIRVEVKGRKPLYIASFYISPSNDDPEVINKLHESVAKLTCRNDNALENIIINGYFNTPDIIWDVMTVRSNPNYPLKLNNTMIDFVNANFLTQLVDKPTRFNNMLDLVLTRTHILCPTLISTQE